MVSLTVYLDNFDQPYKTPLNHFKGEKIRISNIKRQV